MTQELVDAIRVLRIELQIANDRVASAAGLNPRDLDVLDVIDRDGPCTPSYLASRTGIRAATLTGVLSRLESQGWVCRTADPGDRRSSTVSSTERFDELRALYARGDGAAKALAAGLTDEERAVVTRFLTGVAEAAADAARRL